VSDGATEHEALDNALKAIEEWIAHARAHGKDIPLPRMRERHPA
jgi:predicted RNase H-like HicB family nuclease